MNTDSILKLPNIKVDVVSSNGLSKYVKPQVDHEKQLIYFPDSYFIP